MGWGRARNAMLGNESIASYWRRDGSRTDHVTVLKFVPLGPFRSSAATCKIRADETLAERSDDSRKNAYASAVFGVGDANDARFSPSERASFRKTVR